MKKRSISFLLITVMLLLCMPLSAFAAELAENSLKSSNLYAGNQFEGIDSFTLTNPLGIQPLDPADPAADFSYWHIVDTSKEAQYAILTFQDAAGSPVAWTVNPCKSNQHYAVITPSAWKLLGGISYSNSSGNFALSHSGRHEQRGIIRTDANVEAAYFEITPHEAYARNVDVYFERDVDEFYSRDVDAFYERDVDQFYERNVDAYFERDVDEYYERDKDEYYERDVDAYFERDVDEYYERDVDTFFERDVDEYYERDMDAYYGRDVDEYYERDVENVYVRPVYELYIRNAQRSYVPVFARKVNSLSGTLVTRLDYSGNTKKAVPVNGGAFKNGHTYVAVDVEQASSEDGVWYTIADSSKNNGKKTPSQYNKPIDYRYNVKIRDGKLILSFDEDLVSASVGAYVVGNVKNFPGSAPAHREGGIVVDMPGDAGAVVYLYAHFARLEWYADPAEYVFVEWRYDGTAFGDYYLTETRYGEYALIDTLTGEYQQVATQKGDYVLENTVCGEYQLVDTAIGEYALVRTENGEYALVNTVYGAYELVDTKFGDYELVRTENGDYELVNTVNGEYQQVALVKRDYELVNTVHGEYERVNTELGDYVLVDTKLGAYEPVNTVYGDYELVDRWEDSRRVETAYPNGLTLTVNGTVMPLGKELSLTPGSYTFVLSSNAGDFAPITKEVVVAPGDNGTVDFGTFTVELADVVLDTVMQYADREAVNHYADRETVKHYADNPTQMHYNDREAQLHYADRETAEHYADREATRHYADREAEQHFADRPTTEHFADREAALHYADREAMEHYADRDAVKHYADRETTEHYADHEATQHYADREVTESRSDAKPEKLFDEIYIYLPDLYLGNETDPFHEYAIRLS